MRFSNVVLLGGLVAAYATNVTSDGTSSPNRLLYSGFIPAPYIPPPGSTPLSITLSCAGAYYCTATASGGSGTGYSFTWLNAVEMNDANGSSEAYPDCYMTQIIAVQATVTDSNGATASARTGYFCNIP